MEDGDKPFELDLDLDAALGLATKSAGALAPAAVRSSKFAPKLGKGKLKAEPAADPPCSVTNPSISVKKDEPGGALIKKDEAQPSVSDGLQEPSSSAPMEVDVEEDVVVREIDVFFTPSPLDQHTQLYVMQYPLRPSWRPYELSERCEEVRVKPKQSKIEVDLSLDVESDNYDQEVSDPLRLRKQTLSSSKVPFATHYAVGLLIGNKLHLNPVHAVVQLRPSPEHLNVGGLQKRKNITQSVDVGSKSDEKIVEQHSKQSVNQGKLESESPTESIDDSEPWVSLEYCDNDSPFSGRYQQKMVAGVDGHIRNFMNPCDYINSLCPGTSTGSNRTLGPSRRILLSMPLEERLERWVREGPQVNRFDALMHLALSNSAEDVLKVLQCHAYLVQGLWISKSSLLYEEPEDLARDYILYLFSRNHVIPKDKLRQVSRYVDKLMPPLAVERTLFEDWKFKEDTDTSFIKKYPHIVKEQEHAWSTRHKQIMESFHKRMSKNYQKPDTNSKGAASGKVDPSPIKAKDMSVSSLTTARGTLQKAVQELFEEHKILSQSIILHQLRAKATHRSSLPKDDPKAKTAVAAANGASVSQPELESILSEIAVNIHGVYVLKKGKNPDYDPLRQVVIKLFQGKEANSRVKKQDVQYAAKYVLKRDIKDVEFQQVMNDLCESSRAGWTLKRGYGNQS